MQQEHVTLKWGDIIRIHGVNKSKKNTTKGLVISKGFTDPNIYYQTYEEFSDVNFYRESLFQILPSINFDMHDQLLNEELTKDQKENLRNRAQGEIAALENVLLGKAGKQIKFGSSAIFRHVESKAYMRGMLKAADTGEGAFKIEVSNNLSSFLIFKIISHRSYENENDKIYYDDAIQIYHPSSDSFMNFDENQNPIYLDIPEQLEPIPKKHPCLEYSKNRPSIKRPVNYRTSIINENKSKCLWKFIQHSTEEEYMNKQKITSHDIVYFKHTKKGEESLVSTTINEPLVSYLKQSLEGTLSYECFWELIPKEVNEFGPEDCNSFWARNIITGQLLKFGDFSVEIKHNGEQSGKGFDNRGLINLICSESENPEDALKLQRDAEMPIDENMSVIEKYYEKKNKKITFKSVNKLPKDIFMIFKVGDQNMANAQYILSAHEPLVKFVEKLSSELIGQIYEDFDYSKFFLTLNEDNLSTIVQILKLLTARIYDTDYENIVASGNTPNKDVQKVLVEAGITQILIEIIYYLYLPFKFIERNNEPSDDRAIRLKIMDIFEHIYRLLEKIAVNYEDNRIYLSRWVDLFLLHSNNVNKNYIQQCLVGILQNNPASIQATINQNKIVSLIDCFFKQAKNSDEFLTTKYMRLFSTFIRCQNEVIKENQQIILEQFFKNPSNQLNFRFRVEYRNDQIDDDQDPFKVKSKEVLISFGKSKFVTLPIFFKQHKNKWNYFLSYVNLLADISMKRNNVSIDNVNSILSLQAVAVILFDPEILKLNEEIILENQAAFSDENRDKIFPIENIHAPFIRIAHAVYVDNEKFQPIKRIKKISSWYRNEDVEGPIFEDINKTKRVFQGEKQEQQQRYLQSILQYIKVYLKNCNQDQSNLEMLSIILDLLKSTIVLGLWKSITFFRELIPLLVTRITKIDSGVFFNVELGQSKTVEEMVNENKEKLKMNRPEITQSIQCKIKSTEIFMYMNELEIDIRLRYLMNFFKGLYQSTENFNEYDHPLREDIDDDAEDEVKERNQRAKTQYVKMDNKAILGDAIQRMSKDVDVMLKENVWYNKLAELTPYSYVKTDDPMKDRYLFQGEITEGEIINPDEQFNNIILSLMELSSYNDDRLLNSSVKMLRTIFEQRKDLLDNFKKILICGRGNMQEVYVTLKFMRIKFKMLADANILNYQGESDKAFTYEIKKNYDYLVKDREKRSGIIEDLFFLARTLKDGISLKNIESLMHVDDDVFNPYQVYNFIDEKEKNNKLFQSLNLAEEIYLPLIEYIKITNQSDKPLPQIHRKLLLSIYQYLTLLCFNNLQAKQMLMHYIPHFLPHLKKRVGASSLLYEVTRNNKLLVSNEEAVSLIIENALDSCVHLDRNQAFGAYLTGALNQDSDTFNNDFQKSRILFSLRGILLYNDQGHKRNQQLLMNRLQDLKYKNKLIFHGKVQCQDKLNNFNLNASETYIAYHFELFSVLVESQNLINIGKLENIHPYEYCLDCISNTNRWEIRRSLRAYINRLYYVNKDKDIFLFEKFIRQQFDILNSELGDLVELHKSRLLTENLKIKNGIRFCYAQSQIFLVIIECLITLHEMFLKTEFIRILRRELTKQEKFSDSSRPLHEKMIKLYKNLGCLKKIYDKIKIIDPFIKEVKRLLDEELERLQVRYLEKKSEPEEELVKNQEQISSPAIVEMEKKSYSFDHSKSFFRNLSDMIIFLKAKQNLDNLKEEFQKSKKQANVPEAKLKARYLNTIFNVPNEKLRPYFVKKQIQKPAHYDPHLQTASSRIFKVLAKPEFNENDENIELNHKLNDIKVMIDDSPVFDKFKDDEFIYLVKKVVETDEISKTYYSHYWEQYKEKESKPVVSLTAIINETYSLIMNKPDKIQDKQKIFVLKLSRYFLTEAVEEKQTFKLDVDKWDAQYCGENELFCQRQHILEECGASDLIISILKENLTGRIDLLNEALLLGIAYLFGGNATCQNSILNSLRKDSENVMLISMRNLIKNIGDFLITVRKIKENEKVRNFAYNIVDTYDYFSSEEMMILKYFGQTKSDKFEIQTELDIEKALCRIFRFLQLFCENNNKEMKMFLSCQINEDESKKTNSINFIEEASFLLKKIFKVMNNKLVMLPGNLLSFIGEITQVPILSNQISFMKSTFFEDISYMASFFDSPQNKLQRKFNLVAQEEDDPLDTLHEIYTQGVQLALSNFEGNQFIIIREFLNKCQPKYLWFVIRNQMWTLLKTKYTNYPFVVIDDNNDRKAMIQTLSNFNLETIQTIIQEERKNKDFDGPIMSIIEVLIILKKIDDFAAVKQKSAFADKENPNLEDSADAKKAREFRENLIETGRLEYAHIEKMIVIFEELIFQIEVNCENQISKPEKLQYIYFPNHPVFAYLAGDTRDRIMIEVKRETSRDKLISLLDFREEVYQEIKWNYDMDFYCLKLRGKQIPISITSTLYENVRKSARNCSYIICALLFYFIYAEHDIPGQTTYFTFRRLTEQVVIRSLCAIQLALSLLSILIWYMMRGHLAQQKYLRQLQDSEEQAPQQAQPQQQQQSPVFIERVKKFPEKFMRKAGQILNKIKQKFYQLPIYKNLIEPIWAMYQIESQFLSIALFLVTAFMGNFTGVEWYTVHLFDFFVNIPMLANVFKAIVQNIKVLSILSVLAGAFIMIFNVLSLSTYVPVIYEDEVPEQACESIIECVLQVYTSGAIGDDMDEFMFGRFFFDILYVVFMELLFQNLVGGIMIDAYTALTSQDQEREEDKKGKCYICSMTKSNIEKQGTTFSRHTDKHFLWNYIYYIYCLQNKDPTDYTGIQYIISTKISQEDVSWFPALGEEDSGGEIEGMMTELEEKVDKMKENGSLLLSKSVGIFEESNRALKKINHKQFPAVE